MADTRHGRYLEFDKSLNLKGGLYLEGLNYKVRDKDAPEWLQNASYLPDGTLSLIDMHRSHIWLVNQEQMTFRGIKMPSNWALQELHFFLDDSALSSLDLSKFNSQPVMCLNSAPCIEEELPFNPTPIAPDWEPKKREILWKTEVEALFERTNWKDVRNLTVMDFAKWIGEELGINIAIVEQSTREAIIARHRELTGFDYSNIYSYSLHLEKILNCKTN